MELYCFLLTAMRLGKSVDFVQGALASSKLQDIVLRLCLVVYKLGMAGYLLIDNVVWAAKLKLLSADAAKLNRLAARFWLISILAALTRNAFDIANMIRAEIRHRQRCQSPHGRGMVRVGSDSDSHEQSIVARVAANRPLVVDSIKNICDVFLPLATLGYLKTTDGFQGLMGMISSYVGIMTIWDPALKLSPS